jgi:hypothetical protein
MKKTAEPTRRYAILDADGATYRRYLGQNVYLCRSADEIARLYDNEVQGLTWITYSRRYTDELLKAVGRRQNGTSRLAPRRNECLLTVVSPRPESIPGLHGIFRQILGDSPAYRWLPKEELTEVLLGPDCDRSEFFLAAAADPVTKTLSLVRGDCQQCVVPFALFPPSGDGTKPDFAKLGITDYGRTIGLGAYEASADVILYETDPDYRKKLDRQRKETERSFGASLLRLRKQRRLGRADFAPLAAKTIARIERNEIEKPHGQTLQRIADRLGVPPEAIGTY